MHHACSIFIKISWRRSSEYQKSFKQKLFHQLLLFQFQRTPIKEDLTNPKAVKVKMRRITKRNLSISHHGIIEILFTKKKNYKLGHLLEKMT